VIIVDSTVWIDYFRGVQNVQTEYFDHQLGQQPFGLTDLLQGTDEEDSFAQVLRELRRFELFETGGAGIAIEASRNSRRLRQHGHSVRKTIDCLIATFCLLHGHSLLHRDRDFDLFEQVLGLAIVHP